MLEHTDPIAVARSAGALGSMLPVGRMRTRVSHGMLLGMLYAFLRRGGEIPEGNAKLGFDQGICLGAWLEDFLGIDADGRVEHTVEPSAQLHCCPEGDEGTSYARVPSRDSARRQNNGWL